MNEVFEIKTTKANRDGSLPEHYDVILKGTDHIIATVWDSRAMAEEFVKFLETYPQRRKTA